MVRFLLDKFRQAPGPLKQPRLILADLAEEVADLVGSYIENKRYGSDHSSSAEVKTAGDPVTETPAKVAQEVHRQDPPEDESNLDLDPRLAKTMSVPGNKRKQEFKVLAILWDARQRGMPPMSAKSVSNHGAEMGLAIRHENVRKVIRMRLEKHITVHAEGVGSGTIYRYQLADSGVEYFTTTYFE